MRFLASSFLVILSLTCLQNCTSVTALENEYSPDHVSIQYANVSIVPPDGMGFNPVGTGFANEWSHLRMEVIFRSVGEIASVFTDSILTENNFIKISEESLKINGYRALSVLMEDNKPNGAFHKSAMIIGDENSSVIITATYPADSTKMALSVDQSLRSLIFEPNRQISDESVFFRFDLDTASFKIAEVTNIGTLLTPTGSPNLFDVDAFMGATIELVDINPSQMLPYVKARIGFTPESDSTEYQFNKVNIGGLDGYETIHTNDRRMMFVTFLFNEGKLYRFGGASKSNYDQNEVKFRHLVSHCSILQ